MTPSFVPIKRLARVTYGLGQPPPERPEGIPIIRATNIHRGKILDVNLLRVNEYDLPLTRVPLLKLGEILVVRSGAYTGDSALITERWEGASPGYDLRITPSEAVEPRFLAYQLLSTGFLEQIELAKSRAAQPHLNAEELGEIAVAYRPRSEQRATADFLDRETARIDTLIAAKESVLGMTVTRTRAVADQLAAEARRTSPTVRIRHVSDLITSGSRGWAEYVTNEGALFLRITNLQRLSIDLLLEDIVRVSPPKGAEGSRTRVVPGDVLVSITADVGSVAVVSDDLGEAFVSQHVALVRPKAALIDPSWLAVALFSSDAQQQMDSARYGGTKTQLALDDVGDITIPVPSLHEQRKGVERFRLAYKWTAELERLTKRHLRVIRERRQALVTATVTGQLDVAKAS